MNISVFFILFVLLFSSAVFAGNDNALRIERSKDTDVDLRITSLGVFGLSGGSVGHIDLAYIESEGDGNGLALDLGGGVAYEMGGTFFMGIGVALGYNWDDRGFIGAYYPEVGVVYQLTKGFGLVATGKRYYNLYDSLEDEKIIMFGLLFSGE